MGFQEADFNLSSVVGSGPAGLQAALTASNRGHDVTLYEKNNRLGGALYYVGLPEFKKDYRDYTDYIVNEVKNSSVDIKINTEANVKTFKEGRYDKVLVATGASTFVPGINGTDEGNILDPLKVLDGEIPEGEEVLVCGAGLVGCEVSMFLAERGKKVTMIDMLPEPAMELAIYTRWVLNAKLAELGVDVKCNQKIEKMTEDSVKCLCDEKESEFKADAVVCALGLKSDRSLLDDLRKELKNIDIIPIGDVNEPRKIIQAVHEGYHAARRI
ncbi:MAG: FAD-dependent oxidoreductase [Tissierellales bacterium]|nr:FAD-dependent oxidoreductase [Tissierellales bacterium]